MDENGTNCSKKHYEPVNYYISKKKSGTVNEDGVVESEMKSDADLKQEYRQLSEKKILKFVKKAEKEFDADHEDEDDDEKTDFLPKYLDLKELEILLKSYGMPERIPTTVKQYFYRKQWASGSSHAGGEQENGEPLNIGEISSKFAKLTDKEKSELTDEYCEIEEKYAREFNEFLNNLPKTRFHDYRYYVQHTVHRIPSQKLSRQEKQNQEKTKSQDKLEKEVTRLAYPHEMYFQKNEDKYTSDPAVPAHVAKVKARTDYGKLEDKKKLKYIKKSERYYDENEAAFVNQSGERVYFSTFLNKHDLQIYMNSLGLPKKVPNNISNYYVNLNFEKRKDDHAKDVFRNIMDTYKNLTPGERDEFAKQHAEDLKNYMASFEEFKRNLPESRLVDYELYEKRMHPRLVTRGKQPAVKTKFEPNGNTTNGNTSETESGANDLTTSPSKKQKTN